MRREFEPLRFTPGKRGGGLSQAQISEADFVQHLQFGNDLRSIDEKCKRLAHRELQNLMDVSVVVTDFQHAALEARAAAFLADELDVREKLHFHGDRAVALARLAAPARHVERKMPGGIAPALGIRSVGKRFANSIKRFQIRCGIRVGGATNRRLVDDNRFDDLRVALGAVAEFLGAAAVAFGRQRAIQNIMNQRGLPRAADAGHHRQHSERNHQVHALQIVQRSAEQAQEFAVRLVAIVRNRNAQLSAEISPGERFLLAEHGLVRAREEQLAAELAGAMAEIDHMIRRQNRVRIMLDDQNGVAEIAQRFQDINQPLRIARMQADGRFIENVQRADQMRAQRRRKLNALRFPARQRGGQAVQREIIEADLVQKLQPRAHFLQNLVGNLGLRFRELQLREKHARFFHRELADVRDGFSGHVNSASFRAQPCAAAFRARSVTAIAAEKNPHMQLVFLALQPSEETLHAVVIVFWIAFQNQPALLGGEMPPRHVGRNTLSSREFLQILKERAVAGLGPWLDRAIVDGLAGIRYDEIQIEIDGISEALAARARAVRIIEGKQARLRLLIQRAIVLALKAFIEDQPLRSAAARFPDEFKNGLAPRFAIANLEGIDEA